MQPKSFSLLIFRVLFLLTSLLFIVPALPAQIQKGGGSAGESAVLPTKVPSRVPIAKTGVPQQAISTEITLPPSNPRINAYNRVWYILYFVGFGWELLGLGLLVRLRVAPRLRDWLEQKTRFRFLHAAGVYAVISLFLMLWNLPIGFYAYLHERAYGFATQPITLWLMDHGRGYLFSLLSIPAVWIGYWLLSRQPKRWWLWLWLASIPWQLAMIVFWPVVVAPTYNHFVPLQNRELRDKLLAEASQAGIEGARVFQVDISKRTTKLNAYVTGIGPTKRIVLWDTTLKALSEDEILAIMGHEMGHYVLGHIWWRFGEGVVGAFILLWLLHKLLPWLVRVWGTRYGVRDVGDIGGLPIALFALQCLLFLQTPVESALSRMHEHAADRYGLELTHKNEAMARAFVTFVTHDYSDPDPPKFLVYWFYSHPPLKERVDFALHYHPTNEARPTTNDQ
jgi:STE24 endopeptidase